MSSMTDCASVGDGEPDRLAEGAATGTPHALRKEFAVLSEGILTPTVSSPAVTLAGILSDLRMIIVIGPGMKASISFLARGVTSETMSSI